MILAGQHECVIDAKNRLSIPSKLREQLDPELDGHGYFVVLESELILSIYPDRYFQRLVEQRPSSLTHSEDRRIFDRVRFGLSSPTEPDKQGRILLPDWLIKRAKLGKNVILTGAGDHMELWDQPRWEAFVEQNLPRLGEITSRVLDS